MNFPLFDLNDLDPKSRPTDALPAPSRRPDASAPSSDGAGCPPDRPRPMAYLRDLVVILLVVAALATLLLLARYVPTWL
jgi:hypothetical protein